MGTWTAVLCSLFLVQMLQQASGEPSYYRQYRILSRPAYQPYTNYYSYNTNPYVSHPYRYSSDDTVYITDKYGNTVAQSGSSYSSRYVSATATTSSNYGSYYSRGMVYGGCETGTCTCTASTCGQNAQCSIIGGRPVCSCFRGYLGDPLHHCTRAECLDNSECRGHQTCQSGRCIDPCANACGSNADCSARNHVPVCSCPPGYTGDPFSSCRRFDPSELCHPSPCGQNTLCEVVNGVPTCKCQQGYQGSPLAGCRHECDSDAACGSNLACIDFRCQNPCQKQCGENADCEIVRNHQAVCKCPKNYFGNPYSSCKPECYGDVDCPRGRPACFYGICKNPCDGVCGVGANCELRGLTPICSCPKDMTGDPFVSCRPFTPQDLCEPNPCGINARCEPGFETRNPSKERPVCFCLTGYTGDPIRGCQRGECTEDVHCPNSQACIDYKCQNPCIGQCGANAQCNPRNHIAVCTCPTGYNGDALVQCNVVQSTSAARYIRYKRALETVFGNSSLVYNLV